MKRPPKLNSRPPRQRREDLQPQFTDEHQRISEEKETDPTLAVILGVAGCLLLLLFMFFVGGMLGSSSVAKSATESGAEEEVGTTAETEVAQQDAKEDADDSSRKGPEPEPTPSKPNEKHDSPSEQVADESRETDNSDREIADLPVASGEAVRKGAGRFFVGGSFFGVQARGNRFIYVVDCSGSMAGTRLATAKKELKRSIEELGPEQSFSVYFFATSSFPMFYPQSNPTPLAATPENKQKALRWIDDFDGSGGTAPEESLLSALQLEPDAIYLLTDGEFETSTVDTVSQANTDSKVIHTIGFNSRSGEPLLKQLAKKNRGVYRFVK